MRARQILGDVVLYALGSLIALTAYAILSNLGSRLPEMIDAAFPVVRFGYVDRQAGQAQNAIQNIYRDDDKVCWSLYIEKVFNARVIEYDFFADGGDTSAKMAASAYLVNAQNDPLPETDKEYGRLVNHNAGDQWHRRYCFDVAGRIPSFKTITVTGYAEHKRWPYLWTTITTVPGFSIAPLKSAS